MIFFLTKWIFFKIWNKH